MDHIEPCHFCCPAYSPADRVLATAADEHQMRRRRRIPAVGSLIQNGFPRPLFQVSGGSPTFSPDRYLTQSHNLITPDVCKTPNRAYPWIAHQIAVTHGYQQLALPPLASVTLKVLSPHPPLGTLVAYEAVASAARTDSSRSSQIHCPHGE